MHSIGIRHPLQDNVYKIIYAKRAELSEAEKRYVTLAAARRALGISVEMSDHGTVFVVPDEILVMAAIGFKQ